jgi:hypothetical protein
LAFTTILPQQNRSGSGTTPGRQLAAGTGGQVSFRMPMALADIQDTRNHLTFEFQVSNDNASFRTWIGPQTWDGGPASLDRSGNPVGPNCQGSLGPGTWFVRLTYSLSRSMNVGLDMEIIEN